MLELLFAWSTVSLATAAGWVARARCVQEKISPAAWRGPGARATRRPLGRGGRRAWRLPATPFPSPARATFAGRGGVFLTLLGSLCLLRIGLIALEPLDARADVAEDVALPAVPAVVVLQFDLGSGFFERRLRRLREAVGHRAIVGRVQNQEALALRIGQIGKLLRLEDAHRGEGAGDRRILRQRRRVRRGSAARPAHDEHALRVDLVV